MLNNLRWKVYLSLTLITHNQKIKIKLRHSALLPVSKLILWKCMAFVRVQNWDSSSLRVVWPHEQQEEAPTASAPTSLVSLPKYISSSFCSVSHSFFPSWLISLLQHSLLGQKFFFHVTVVTLIYIKLRWFCRKHSIKGRLSSDVAIWMNSSCSICKIKGLKRPKIWVFASFHIKGQQQSKKNFKRQCALSKCIIFAAVGDWACHKHE